jgi:hypothetical protein
MRSTCPRAGDAEEQSAKGLPQFVAEIARQKPARAEFTWNWMAC